MTVSSLAAKDRPFPRERRQHPRIPAPHISASPFDGDLDIVNLSRRGMSVLSHHPLSVGGTYLFELWQEGNSLVVEGVVRWSNLQSSALEAPTVGTRYRAGVAFERVRSRERRDPWPTEVTVAPERGRSVDRLAGARSALAEAESIGKVFVPKRELMLQSVEEMGMIVDRVPDGTFYVFVSLRELPEPLSDGLAFFRAALDRQVICVPGVFFDVNPGRRRARHLSRFHQHVRLSFGPSQGEVERGLKRLKSLIAEAG